MSGTNQRAVYYVLKDKKAKMAKKGGKEQV